MKYIIEFHDEPELMEEGLSYYTCVDAPWWSASDHLIGKLTPYKEGEEYQRGFDDAHKISIEECQRPYERGIAEAWDFARHLNAVTSDITDNIYLSANGGKGMDVALEMTYEDAKKEYEEYFQRKKEKAFCVGAEVENKSGEHAFVLIPDYNGCLVLSMEKFVCPQIQQKHNWKCTGHVSEFIKRAFEYESNED